VLCVLTRHVYPKHLLGSLLLERVYIDFPRIFDFISLLYCLEMGYFCSVLAVVGPPTLGRVNGGLSASIPAPVSRITPHRAGNWF